MFFDQRAGCENGGAAGDMTERHTADVGADMKMRFSISKRGHDLSPKYERRKYFAIDSYTTV